MKKILLIITLLLTVPAMAQQFDFSINGGLNMCQIDGDGSGPYNRMGFHAGVNTSFPLGYSDFRMLIEVGVCQKGSTIKSLNRTITATYIEVPILLTYNWPNLRLGAGVAPAFLGKATVKTGGEETPSIEQIFRKMDILPVTVDALYRFGDHLGIEARWSTSLLPITTEASSGTYRLVRSNKGAFHRLVSLGVNYTF